MSDENVKKDPGEYTPVPEKDPTALENNPGDKVKVEESGKATPTEETAKEALANQEPAEKAAEKPAAPRAPISDEEREAKLKRAAEARAARAAAKGEGAADAPGATGAAAATPAASRRAAKAEAAEEAKPKEPSPRQPELDRAVAIISELAGADAIEHSFINDKSADMPTVTIKNERWLIAAETIKSNPELAMNYLRNLSGVDQETHLEVVYHFINMTTMRELCVKVKTDRDNASIPSVTPLYETANWHEREVYDLLGVRFPGHPDLRRIMMPDDWAGHPLRKDYEPLDPEV